MQDFIIKKTSAVKSLKRHHPWIFSGAVSNLVAQEGELIRLFSESKEFLGTGYFCKDSSIRIRILSFKDTEINFSFWKNRIGRAANIRKSLIDLKKTNCFRLINSEGDFVPGLIIDVYGKYAVVDFHIEGVKTFQEDIDRVLRELGYQPIYSGEESEKIKVVENDYNFLVSPGKGQKTGFFLDQRDNRRRMQNYCKGKNVLNMFSYTAGFSVYALKAGAKSVVNVDSSAFAIEQAKENYKLNGLKVNEEEFIVSDAFEYLEQMKENGIEFDVIILDPPAFVKHKDSIRRALSGYRRLNYLGMKVCSSDGVLATFSCSGHISNEDLRRVVWQASMDATCSVQILENPLNQLDHPINMNLPEGEYLKGIIGRITK